MARKVVAGRSTGAALNVEVDAVVVGDPPVAHHQDPVAQRDRLVDVVGDEQHRRVVALAQPPHQVVHAQAGDRVQRGERLVEQHQVRVGDERAGERHALRLAA